MDSARHAFLMVMTGREPVYLPADEDATSHATNTDATSNSGDSPLNLPPRTVAQVTACFWHRVYTHYEGSEARLEWCCRMVLVELAAGRLADSAEHAGCYAGESSADGAGGADGGEKGGAEVGVGRGVLLMFVLSELGTDLDQGLDVAHSNLLMQASRHVRNTHHHTTHTRASSEQRSLALGVFV